MPGLVNGGMVNRGHSLVGGGLVRAAEAGGGNGLLTGLTEAWRPDASLALIGQKTGLNTNTDAGLIYTVQAGFPGGFCLQSIPGSSSNRLITSASPLVESIGLTDIMAIQWVRCIAPDGPPPGFGVNAANTNGFDFGAASLDGSGDPVNANADMPWSDGSYDPFVETTGEPFTLSVVHMLTMIYTASDMILSISVDAGTIFSATPSIGAGPTDPTNYVYFDISGFGTGFNEMGPVYIWQGAGVTNAVSQISNLYMNKLQYSDFT